MNGRVSEGTAGAIAPRPEHPIGSGSFECVHLRSNVWTVLAGPALVKAPDAAETRTVALDPA